MPGKPRKSLTSTEAIIDRLMGRSKKQIKQKQKKSLRTPDKRKMSIDEAVRRAKRKK